MTANIETGALFIAWRQADVTAHMIIEAGVPEMGITRGDQCVQFLHKVHRSIPSILTTDAVVAGFEGTGSAPAMLQTIVRKNPLLFQFVAEG